MKILFIFWAAFFGLCGALITTQVFGSEVWLSPMFGTSQWDNQKADQTTGFNLSANLPIEFSPGWWARPRLDFKQWVASFSDDTSTRKTLINVESRMVGGGLSLSRKLRAEDLLSSDLFLSLIAGKSFSRALRQESTPQSFASSSFNGITGNYTQYELGYIAPLSQNVKWLVSLSRQQFWTNWESSTLTEDSMVSVPSGLALNQKNASLVTAEERPPMGALIKTTYLQIGISLTL